VVKKEVKKLVQDDEALSKYLDAIITTIPSKDNPTLVRPSLL